jgi:hypothetical protein
MKRGKSFQVSKNQQVIQPSIQVDQKQDAILTKDRFEITSRFPGSKCGAQTKLSE